MHGMPQHFGKKMDQLVHCKLLGLSFNLAAIAAAVTNISDVKHLTKQLVVHPARPDGVGRKSVVHKLKKQRQKSRGAENEVGRETERFSWTHDA